MRLRESAGARTRLLQVAVAAAGLAAPALAATQASAATLAVGAPCYVNADASRGTPILVTGTGYTPGDTIGVKGQGVFGTATVAADGTLTLITDGPILATSGPASKTFMLTAIDATSGAGAVAAGTVTMANLSVATSPTFAKPSRKLTWSFSGFSPGRTVYVHYLRKNRVLGRMAFGRAKGPCGLLKARDLFYPGGHPKYSKYTVVFDQVQKYTTRARPRIISTLSFF